MTIKAKSLLWFLLPAILMAAVTATFCYFYTYKTVKKNIFCQLEIAADDIKKHVNVFLEGKRGRIIDFSSDGFVRDCTEEIILRKERIKYYTDRLNSHLNLNKKPLDPDILEVFVVDLDGKVFSSTEDKHIGNDVSGEKWFSETMRKGFYISDIKCFTEFKQDTFFDVARLILTNDGLHTIGIIANRYSGDRFRKITQTKVIGESGQVKELEGLGESGEVYIVDRDKLMITESRFNNNPMIMQVVDTEGVRQAFDNEVGMIGIFNSYRGHRILGVFRYIEEMDWVVVAEKGISEAFAPLVRLRNFTIFMGLAGTMIIFVASIFFSKKITGPITSLALVAGEIANGKIEGIEGIKSRDEIGNLADSFNKMAINLKKSRKELEQSERRYRDLVENSTEIIYQTDKNGLFSGMNKTMLDKLGFKSHELKGMRLDDIVPAKEKQKVMSHLQKVVEKGSDSVETMFLSALGEIIHVEINANAVCDGRNSFIETRAFVRDITERRKAEAAEKHGKELQLLASHIISIQEKERRRISRELHDETGQALTAMKINIEMIEKNVPKNATNIKTRLVETKQLVMHTLHEMRSLAFDLRPSLLDHFGALAAIKEYSKNYSERTNINVQVRGENIVERFSPETDILLYRCAQEALNNVAKHSKATDVTINITQGENEICMKIEDNGKGFDITAPFEKNMDGSGIGLFGMKERVALLNGNLEIHSEKNKGCKIEIFVPFIRANNASTFPEVIKCL